MNEENAKQVLDQCKTVLSQVEKHAMAIKLMHDHMQELVEQNKKLQDDLQLIQEDEMQRHIIKMASKAAKKAAKKSIAKAQIRDAYQGQDIDN